MVDLSALTVPPVTMPRVVLPPAVTNALTTAQGIIGAVSVTSPTIPAVVVPDPGPYVTLVKDTVNRFIVIDLGALVATAEALALGTAATVEALALAVVAQELRDYPGQIAAAEAITFGLIALAAQTAAPYETLVINLVFQEIANAPALIDSLKALALQLAATYENFVLTTYNNLYTSTIGPLVNSTVALALYLAANAVPIATAIVNNYEAIVLQAATAAENQYLPVVYGVRDTVANAVQQQINNIPGYEQTALNLVNQTYNQVLGTAAQAQAIAAAAVVTAQTTAAPYVALATALANYYEAYAIATALATAATVVATVYNYPYYVATVLAEEAALYALAIQTEQNLAYTVAQVKYQYVDPVIVTTSNLAAFAAATATAAAYGALATAQKAVADEQAALPGQEAYALALIAAEEAFALLTANNTLATALATEAQVKQQYVDPNVTYATGVVAGLQALATQTVNGAVATALAAVYKEIADEPGQVAGAMDTVNRTVTNTQNTLNALVATANAIVAQYKAQYIDPAVVTAFQKVADAQAAANAAVATANAIVAQEIHDYPGQIAFVQATALATAATVTALVAAEQAAVTLLAFQTKATYVDPNVAYATAVANGAVATATATALQTVATIQSTAAGAPAQATALVTSTAATAAATAAAAQATATILANQLKATYVDPTVAQGMALVAAAQATANQNVANIQYLANQTVNGVPGMVANAQKQVADQQAAATALVNATKTGTVDPLVASTTATVTGAVTTATNAVNAAVATATQTMNGAVATIMALAASAPGTVASTQAQIQAQMQAVALMATNQMLAAANAAALAGEQAYNTITSANLTKPRRTYFNYPYNYNGFALRGTAAQPVLNTEDGDTGYLYGTNSGAVGDVTFMEFTVGTDTAYKQPMTLVIQAAAFCTGGTNLGHTKIIFQENYTSTGILGPGLNVTDANPTTVVSIPNDGTYHRIVVPVPDLLTTTGGSVCRLLLSYAENVGQASYVKISAAYLEQLVPVIPPTQFNGVIQMVGTTGGLQVFDTTSPTQRGQATLLANGSVLSCNPGTFNVVGVGSLAQVVGTSAMAVTAVLGGGFFVYSTAIRCVGNATETIGGYFAPTTGASENIVGNASLTLTPPTITGASYARCLGSATLYVTGVYTPPTTPTAVQMVGSAFLTVSGASLLVVAQGITALVGLATETVSGYNDLNVRIGQPNPIKTSSTLTANPYILSPVGTEGPVFIISAPDVVTSGSIVNVRVQAVDASGVRLTFVGPPSVRVYNYDAAGNESEQTPYTTTTKTGQTYTFVWQVSGLGPYVIEASGTTTGLGNVVGVQSVLVNQGSSTPAGPLPVQGGVLG